MDPVVAVRDLDHAEMTRDRAAVAEACNALVGWCEKGGFNPYPPENWRSKLNCRELASYFRDLRHVAEMF